MGRMCSPLLLTAAVAVGLLAGCSSGSRVPGLAGLEGIDGGQWRSPLLRDHPLVGRILDVAGHREVTAGQLATALESAEIVLLGERHDNADHHLLQARVLQEMVAGGRRLAVAFEQLDVDRQAAVDAALAKPAAGQVDSVTARANALAQAVDWTKSGWPSFDEYRPVFEVAIAADLPIRAANLSRAAMGHVFAHTKTDEKPTPRETTVVADDAGLSAEARASLAADIKESHCGYANDRMIAMMVRAQRHRDETMAGVVVDAVTAPGSQGAVLICGFGHARTDYGVPVRLHHREPAHRVVSVGFLEVIPGFESPADYAAALHAERLPFDYVVFTPRADDEDPCEKFRAGLEKLKAR